MGSAAVDTEPAKWGTPWHQRLGSRGDLNDCLGFNVDPVNHLVVEPQLEGLFRFHPERIPEKGAPNA